MKDVKKLLAVFLYIFIVDLVCAAFGMPLVGLVVFTALMFFCYVVGKHEVEKQETPPPAAPTPPNQ